MDMLTLLLLAVMPALVIVAGLRDLTTMTIPNWISAALIVAFFPAALASGLDWASVAAHVGVALAALFVGAGMFALRWIGGGDAKLIAAACLWLGVTGSGMFLLWTGLAGGIFCLMLIFARAYARPYVVGGQGWFPRLMEPKGDIPYGVAIAIGALLAYPACDLVAGFASGV
ncbi:MAG TPA: prepilin peptidase [Brevundimonas sp.]|uniref:A24 family peptidase n=1 Tax=Brevundimonas sp. TaxID=1871086 RepID=UPI00261C6097|nr:prepilin peptidase [Brevundimonas sp.]HRO33791.1 prepilin peptidase [Brevundimonas sp.]